MPQATDAIACFLTALQRPAEALPLLRKSLASREAAHGPKHVRTLQSVTALAEALKAAGEYEAALPLYNRAGKSPKPVSLQPSVAASDVDLLQVLLRALKSVAALTTAF